MSDHDHQKELELRRQQVALARFWAAQVRQAAEAIRRKAREAGQAGADQDVDAGAATVIEAGNAQVPARIGPAGPQPGTEPPHGTPS